MSNEKTIVEFKSPQDLKVVLGTQYQKQIMNYFGDEKEALRFLSSVISAAQRTPELLKCTPISVINSFITMAELQLMPSGVSGEAYVLPYAGKAQFQLGYQGLVTLFYRAGVSAINADIVRENDHFEIENGVIHHKINHKLPMSKRGSAIGAYVIIDFKGSLMGKYMHGEDILAHAKKFSKSFKSDHSPWNEKNDPELWMWKKTVLKQASKLIPKNETINKAIGYDNADSNIADKVEAAKKESSSLEMGNLLKNGNGKEKTKANKDEGELIDAESSEVSEEGEVHID